MQTADRQQVLLQLRIPAELRAELAWAAAKTDRSSAGFVRWAIRRALEAQRKAEGLTKVGLSA